MQYQKRVALGSILTALAFCITAYGQEPPANAAYQAELERQWRAHPTLTLGSPAPDFQLPGIDGKTHTLGEYKDSPILAILFTCNHCPAAQMYEARIKGMVKEYGPKGVAIVAIQPNAPAAAGPREMNYTDVEDTLEGMIIRAQFRHFNFPYVYDGETQAVAEKFGPKATPHLFLFDKDRKLQYEGRVDDNMREALVKTTDARNALDAMVAGRPVPVAHTAVFGCATKWKSQVEGKQREAKEFAALPVTLELATEELLKKLRTNPTGKVLMINLWATWCGPCVSEFHDLLTTFLWYRSRDFELVTVSTDSPDAKATVQKFLEKEHSAVRNYQFASDDIYGLQAAFDPKWESGVPFTMVLAPDGKVIYREEGEVNLLALRRAILANLPDQAWVGNAAYWAQQ
jgi:thiol-disulfide isomerase/thioredoxin